jgi:3-hydroxybutyrate dehydrogenase
MPRRKAALVTGSTSSIGLAIAGELAAWGMNLMLNGFGNPAEIEALRARLAGMHGVDVLHDGANMSQQAAIEAMLARAARRWGGIDVLVNNADIPHVAPVDDFPVDKWNAILAFELSAAFHTTRLVLPHMKFNRWGRIVNVSSAHALVASPGKSAAVATMQRIVGFTKTAALELAELGVTVNAVCPGHVLAPRVQGQIPDTTRSRGRTDEQAGRGLLRAAQPSKRFVTTDEVAQRVAFLCSDAAASITGTVMPIHGGWTAH